MVQQNIQTLAFADHLSPAMKQNFPDRKIAQNDACETQTTCILNGALVPFHQGIFSKRNGEIGLMLCFLHCHRRIRRLRLEKMNPITVCIFDVGLIKSRNEFDFLFLKLRTVTEFLDVWNLTKGPEKLVQPRQFFIRLTSA